jgi:Fe-S-cluster containining protein
MPTSHPIVFGEATLTRTSRYSYACHACNRCCRNYRIQVNPYEVLTLARHLGLSTTAFIAEYLEQGPYLAHKDSGACVFLGPSGCAVHPARPLVCRVYPLGREISASGEERFLHMRPHPETEGEYGEDGTIADYLEAQGATPYIGAADRYFSLFHRLLGALQQHALPQSAAQTTETLRAHAGPVAQPLPDLLDPDCAIRGHSAGCVPESLDPQTAMDLHIRAIESWLTFHFEENENEEESKFPA